MNPKPTNSLEFVSNHNELESTIQSILSELTKMHDSNKDLTDKLIKLESEQKASQNVNLTQSTGVSFWIFIPLCLSLVIMCYKYNSLKKKFRTLSDMAKNNVESGKSLIDLFNKNKENFFKIKTAKQNLDLEFKKYQEKLERPKDNASKKKQEIKAAIKIHTENAVKYYTKTLAECLLYSHESIKRTLHIKALEKVSNLQKDWILDRNFSQNKNKNAYIVLSGMSLIVYSYLIDYGLSDICKTTFLTALEEEYFIGSSYDCILSIKDLERVNEGFRVNMKFQDREVESFKKLSLKRLSKIKY